MKKIKIILATLLMGGWIHSFAQESAPSPAPTDDSFKRFYIGARYQFTATSLAVNSFENGNVSTSFVLGNGAGAVLGYNFSKNVALQAELMYNTLSQKYKLQDQTNQINLSYINVPLLLVLNTNVSAPVNLNIAAGPQLGLNTGSSIQTSGGSGTDTVNTVLAVKKGDLGFAYGAGLDFLLSKSLKLSVGYRGVQGLIDISDNSKNITTNDYYILNRSHVITNSGYAGLSILF